MDDIHAWVEEFPGAVTVCDLQGVIVSLNARAAATFAADGGKALIGCNIMDCHPPAAAEKVAALLASGEKNVYTIEKNGLKKIIYQTPWYKNGQHAGLVEISLEIPFDMPHFVRS
jgi:transcriptional regulator with PAS, ATPase and Fis domain